MKRIFRPGVLAAAVSAVIALAGCASVDMDDELRRTNLQAQTFTQGKLELDRSAEQRERRSALAQDLLSRPLSGDDAVQLALANSPALQALLAQSWADMATARQGAQLPNPVFKFERIRFGSELELGRLLSIGLVDLLVMPQRMALAKNQEAQARLQLTNTVVGQVTQVRQAWVRAVAAEQVRHYAEQVNLAAQASAELARRMYSVGNFSKLQRARQQVFYADATTQLATAQHSATAAREALVRQLGLSDSQAAQLQLPERLPNLPAAPRAPQEVASSASSQRLDLQLARAQLDAAGQAQGLNLLQSVVDIEAGVRRDTVFDNDAGSRSTRRGFELDIRLPVFNWGQTQRDAMQAQALAAAYRYDAVARNAGSQLREGYSAYRTAYDVAQHYRDEIVPLRQSMADENLLRYNGMLIGVFELLAEAREQINGVSAAISAQQQFWLADAALAASVMGQPLDAGMGISITAASTAAPAPAH